MRDLIFFFAKKQKRGMKKEEIKTESEREGRKDVKPKKKQGEKRKRGQRWEVREEEMGWRRRRLGSEGRSPKLPLHNRGDE